MSNSVQDEFHGIVMSVREYKDTDAMIKVFTREHGKQMFFVKKLNSGHHHLKAVLVPGTRAMFIGQINYNGLSFLKDYKNKQSLWKQFDDVFIQAYVAYFIAMCDAVVDDRVINDMLFTLLQDTLQLVEKGFDVSLVSLLFDIKCLSFWGVNMNFDTCQISKIQSEPFDISLKYNGVIAKSQWDKDPYRLHVHPNAVYMMNRMQKVSLQQLKQINISSVLADDIRKALDVIYDELVGITLKSKQYIQQLKEWY